MKSMEEVMIEGTRLSFLITYKNKRPSGLFHEVRDDADLTDSEWDMVSGWADGLVQKHLMKQMAGECSLQATIDFDIGDYDDGIRRDVKTMRAILNRVGEPVTLTKEQLIAGGWGP